MWYIPTMGYYSALKKEEILPYVTTWMSLEDIMISEICQSQKDKYALFHLFEVSKIIQLTVAQSRMVVARGLRGRRKRGVV